MVTIYCMKSNAYAIKAKLSQVVSEGENEDLPNYYIICKMREGEIGKLVVNLAEVFNSVLVECRLDEWVLTVE